MQSLLKSKFKYFSFFVILIFASILTYKSILSQDELKMDFRSFYYAAELYSNEINLYDFNKLTEKADSNEYVYPFVYTPLLAQFFSLFIDFDALSLQFTWSIFNLLLIPLIFYQCQFLFNSSNILTKNTSSGIHTLLISVCLLIISPFRYIIIVGQIDLLILSLLLLSLILNKKHKEKLAGFIFAMTILLKYSNGILIFYFLFQKQYKFVAYFILSSLLIFLASYLISPLQWHNFIDFLQISGENGINGLPPVNDIANNSLISLLSKIFSNNTFLIQISVSFFFIGILWTLYKSLKMSNFVDNNNLVLLPFLIFAIIMTPYTWRQHFIYLVPGAFIISIYILNSFQKKRAFLIIAFLAILMFFASFNFSSKIYLFTQSEILASHPILASLMLLFIGLIVSQKNNYELTE